jgi:hypothetical protein
LLSLKPDYSVKRVSREIALSRLDPKEFEYTNLPFNVDELYAKKIWEKVEKVEEDSI